MSLAEIVASNVSLIRDRRSSGDSWDSIATELSEKMGEDVNPASLKVAFSRATRTAETPAQVEKVSKPRAVLKPAEIVKPAVKPDPAEGLRSALIAAETRASAAVKDRDSAREAASKATAERDRLRVEIDRLKEEIEEGKQGGKDQVIIDLQKELSEAKESIEKWEQWASDKGDDAPRSRPIMVAAMVVVALLVGGYGSRFMANNEPVRVASATPLSEVKPVPVKIESGTKSEPVKVQEKGVFDRPAGLPPVPPPPRPEGALTGGKTISLLD